MNGCVKNNPMDAPHRKSLLNMLSDVYVHNWQLDLKLLFVL